MKQQGFTLIELTTVCSIILVIAFAGSSSYSFLIIQAKINSDKTRLISMIRMTRQHSITLNTVTVLCPSKNKIDCERNWKLPLIQFMDVNKNKKRDIDEVIITQFEPFDSDEVSISYPKTQIRFNEEGLANYFNGTLSYCFGESIEGIVISRIGRIRYARDLNGDHIPDVNSVTSVSC